MSEFDEFDAFLVESAEQEAHKLDVKVKILSVQTRITDALNNAGFISVHENESQIDSVIQTIRDFQSEHPDFTDEQAEETLKTILTKQALSEDGAITMLGLALIASEERTGSPTLDELNDTKRRIFAETTVQNDLDMDNPILAAYNVLIPGDSVDAGAEYMVPYLAKAIQEKEDGEYANLQRYAELESIVRGFGVEENDPKWQVAVSEAAAMSLMAAPYKSVYANRANLSAQLHEQQSKLDPELRAKLITYFSTDYLDEA